MTCSLQVILHLPIKAIFARFLFTEKPKKIHAKSSLQGSGAPRQCMHIHLTVTQSVSTRRPAYRVWHCLTISIMESVGREVTADLVKAGLSYRTISARLRELYPHIRRGLSFVSVREYCIVNGLRTARRRAIVTDEELDESAARALAKVCMISLVIYVCFNRVWKSGILGRLVNPTNKEGRTASFEMLVCG